MSKRRKQGNLAGEIAYRLSGLIGLGCFWAGIQFFDDIGRSQQLLFSAIFGAVGMIGSALIFLMIKGFIEQRQRGIQTFDFEQPTTTKHQQATSLSMMLQN